MMLRRWEVVGRSRGGSFEARLSLHWTQRGAQRATAHALGEIERLPLLHAIMGDHVFTVRRRRSR